MHVLQNHIVIAFLVSLVGIALLEFGVYEMDFLIHVTNLEFMSFIRLRLYPTLFLNAVFIILAAYPLSGHFEKFAESLRDDE